MSVTRGSEDWFEQKKRERAAAARRRRRRDGIVFAVLLALLGGGLFVLKSVTGEGESAPPESVAGATSALPSPVAPTQLPTSKGITQEQLDALGASIAARYASGDTEVAEALLQNFMDVHPECVSAVMAGGEGKMRDVLEESEAVAKYLRSTAPRPNTYTTVITVKNDDGSVRAAVLGVSCE